MLRQAIVAWKKLPREKRLLAVPPDAAAADRWRKWEKEYPEDGLVLKVTSRDLPKDGQPQPATERGSWNQDHAWFRREEARSLLPENLEKGTEHTVPRAPVERLVRFHLVDNVHALNYAFFPKESVEKADIKATVIDVENDLVTVRFQGESRAVMKAPFEQGYAPKLLGRAKFNRKQNKFVSFELIAVGERWGTGNCNQRHDPAPAPMGIILRLAGNAEADRLPPAFVAHYGW